MFELSENNRYFFFPEPVRMSYGIDGLSKLVYAHPALSLVSGDIFVFFSHDRKRIKLLRWDGDGFILYYKRLTDMFRGVTISCPDGKSIHVEECSVIELCTFLYTYDKDQRRK